MAILIPLQTTQNLLFNKNIQLSEIAFLILFISWFIQLIRKKIPLIRTPLDISILLFLVAGLLSLINSSDLQKSVIEFAGILSLALLYFLVVNIVKNKKQLVLIIKIWLLVSGLVALIGFGGFIYSLIWQKSCWAATYYPRYSSIVPFPRINATLRDMSMLASYLHIGVLLALGMFLAHHEVCPSQGRVESNAKHQWLFPLALFIAGIVFFTGSRNMFGLAVSIYLLAFCVKKYGEMIRSVLLVMTVSLGIVVIAVTVWCIYPAKIYFEAGSKKIISEINLAPSSYFVLFEAAVKMVKDQPLTGVGLDMYNKKLVDYMDWEKNQETYAAHGMEYYKTGHDPHSAYLGYAAETGLLGLGAMVAMFFCLLRRLARSVKLSNDKFWQILLWSFLAIFAGFLVNGFYSDIIKTRHFWFVAGLGIAAVNIMKKEKT